MSFTTIILSVALAVTAGGAVLTWLGLRGRRVGDHPYCRRCGFDLFGKADDSHVCSECGVDLRRPRASVIGVRTSRRGLVWAGAALLVPTVLALSVIGYGTAKGTDWQKHKPVWWLAREAQRIDITIRDAALAELLVRFGAGTLSKEQVHGLIARGLVLQGDADRPWATAWGDLIEQARLAGDVTDAQWKTYAEQALIGSFTLRFRPRLQRGDPVPYRLEYGPARVGPRSGLWRLCQITGMTIDGAEVVPKLSAAGMTGTLTSRSSGSPMSTLEHGRSPLGDLEHGRHRGALKIEARIAESTTLPPILRPGARPPRPTTSPQPLEARSQQLRDWFQQQQDAIKAFRDGTAPSLTTVAIELPFAFELLAPDVPAVEPVTDTALRERVAAAVSVTRISVMGSMLRAYVNCNNPPIDLSFDVIVRVDGKEWVAGGVTCRAGETQTRGSTFFPTRQPSRDGLDPRMLGERKTVDVILRPSAEAAARSPDIVRYWGEAIVIEGVRLEDPFAEMRRRRREIESSLSR